MSVKIHVVKVRVPKGTNVILGQSHFIKTVEDIYEAMVNTVPGIKFGLAFCEASGDRLIRYDGNNDELVKEAIQVAKDVGAGHFFVLFLKDAYPVNVLQRLKTVPEVVSIYCATANPVEVIVGETQQGRGVLGIIDGFTPVGVEDETKIKERHDFLRKIGYKK